MSVIFIDAETIKEQCRLLDPTPLGCIAGYIMEGAVDDRVLKRLPQRIIKFINGSISSYCDILNSLKRLEQISQSNKLASIMCDLESDCTREKEDKKKRATEAEENRRRKYEEK